jgi:hypothetical protein
MKCYFCDKILFARKTFKETILSCESYRCQTHQIPRYQVIMSDDGYKIYEAFAIDKYYIQIDFIKKTTNISLLHIVILTGIVNLNYPIKFDLSDYNKTLNKIKTLIILS